MRKEPSARIFSNALQFYELTKPAYDNPATLQKTLMAVICNFALSIELLLKSCDAGVKKSQHQPGTLLTDAEIYSNSWGHDLEKIFDRFDSEIKSKVEYLYKETTGKDLRPLLSKYKDYFIHARYAHEPKSGHSYDVSGIHDLAEGLIATIRKW